MRRARTAGRWTALAVLLALAGGCGWFGGDSGTRGGGGKPERAWTAPQLYEGAARGLARAGEIYDIYAVVPNQGPLPGGNPARLDGVFPPTQTVANLYGASSVYQVYFGNNLAMLDATVTPAFTSENIYVIVPPGDAPGFVDVILRDTTQSIDAAVLYDGYEYIDIFEITDVIPDVGPLAGGQEVTVFGRFPVLAPISTAAAAYATYRVYFDGIQAGFNDTVDPIITSERMYVITPPGNAPGLVNVSVATTVPPTQTPEFRVLVDGYEYVGGLELTDVDPDIGHIFGREQVTLTGTFPVTTAFSQALEAQNAYLYYTVLFGNNVAPFDTTVPDPVITPTTMRVLSPPNPDVGFVDVSVIANDDPDIFSTLERAYRYYAMYITTVIPDNGPLSGGNNARITGLIPASRTINDIYEAEQFYTVFFGTNQAAFSDVETPVIASTNIDVINRTYTAGSFYVTVPPGNAPGFVDVTAIDDLGIDLPSVLPDGYRYTDDTGIGRWVEAQVRPNPVGKLPAGDLLVRVEVTGTIGPNDRVLIVPHGQDPSNDIGLIELENTDTGDAGNNNTFWEGTNPEEIPRVLDNNGLVDGIATLIIVTEDGTRLGASTDLSDGGRIEEPALSDRHFLIDTIPPRMLAGGRTGAQFLTSFNDLRYDWVTTGAVVDSANAFGPYPSPQHPYPIGRLSNRPIGRTDFVWDASRLTRPPGPNSRAQIFFNTGSISNIAAPQGANLRFGLEVEFEDVNIYTMLGRSPDPSDANFYTGRTERPVAGFPDNPVEPVSGSDREEALVSGDNIWIRWDFQPTAFTTPSITDIDVSYIPAAFQPNLGLPPEFGGLGQSATGLRGVYRIGLPGNINTGVEFEDVVEDGRTLMEVIFRAVDRAGNYQPRGEDVPFEKIFTENDFDPLEGYANDQQPIVGPVNLWWLLTANTKLNSTVPPSGDARAPSFTWELTGTPDPRATAITNPTNSVERLYNVAIFRSIPDANNDGQRDTREEMYDGPYEMLTGWEDWGSVTAYSAELVETLVENSVPDGIDDGVWFLLVVVGADEAGNVETWPTNQLQISPASIDGGNSSPSRIDFVAETGEEERNWVRWFRPPVGDIIDTRVTPTFWHEDLQQLPNIGPDFGEPNFGDAEVIPLPSPQTYPDQQVIGARFRIRTITDDPDAEIEWTLDEDGDRIDGGTIDANDIAGNEFILTLPFDTSFSNLNIDAFGDVNRQPRYYVFRATTVNDDGTRDTTPANVQFVVVDDVAEFIQSRRTRDVQPIREQDRP